MYLLLIRHGLSPHTVDAAGADPQLSPEGRSQARRLAEHVDRGRYGVVDRVLASPMRRAAQTAAIVDEPLDRGVEFDDRLAEFDRGWTTYGSVMEGYDNRGELFADLNAGRLGDNTFDASDFQRRVVAAIDAASETDSQTTAIVTHGGVINAYLAHVLQMPQMFFTEPFYTSVTRLRVGPSEHRELLSLNEIDHLRGAAPVLPVQVPSLRSVGD